MMTATDSEAKQLPVLTLGFVDKKSKLRLPQPSDDPVLWFVSQGGRFKNTYEQC